MSFQDKYPEFTSIEQHVRRARIERDLRVGAMIGNAVAAIVGWIGRLLPVSAAAAKAPRARRPLVVKARLAGSARA